MDTRLMQQIKDILKEFPQYWNGEELQRPIVIADLKNYDALLISALLKNQKIRENYSVKAGDVVIFKVQEFIDILRYKDYWTDSYTKYSNTIGLSSEGKYFQYNTDVVLDFPYKDCILEGGMTKEDTGKEEVFYNEVIARDEIDTLLAPKAFVNVKKFDADGEHTVDSFSDEDNLIIKGNNLLALYSLKERYAGKVKLIYIDPPYYFDGVQDNDSFDYNPDFKLSTWLVFMKNRINVALSLLREDGYLAIQINDYGAYHLKVMLDEEFSKYTNGKFINDISVKMSDLSGPKMAHSGKKIPKIKEHILLYSKDSTKGVLNPIRVVSTWKLALNRYNGFIERHNSNDSKDWTYTTVRKKLAELNMVYDSKEAENFLIENHSNIFRTAVNKSLSKKAKSLNVNPNVMTKIITPSGLEKFIYNNEEVLFATNKLTNINGTLLPSEPISDMWLDIALNDLSNEGGISLKNGKKPEMLLKRIIEMTTEKEDIVLDFFMGSGTTQAVALKTNRKFIGIEQMDYINDKTVQRLKNTIEGDNRGISKDVNWQGGGSFIYAELMELNQVYMNKIDQALTKEELANLWDELDNNADLNFQLDKEKLTNELLKEYDEEEGSITFNDLTFDEQKEIFKKALDKNQLYVPYSEIEDKNVIISDDDKAFNHSFYSNGGE